MPYHCHTSGTHLYPNRPLASALQSRKLPKTAESLGSIFKILRFGDPFLRFGEPKIAPTNLTELGPGDARAHTLTNLRKPHPQSISATSV
jgi:hypothetical protein